MLKWCNDCRKIVESFQVIDIEETVTDICVECYKTDLTEPEKCLLCGTHINPYRRRNLCSDCEDGVYQDLNATVNKIVRKHTKGRNIAISIMEEMLEAMEG